MGKLKDGTELPEDSIRQGIWVHCLCLEEVQDVQLVCLVIESAVHQILAAAVNEKER